MEETEQFLLDVNLLFLKVDRMAETEETEAGAGRGTAVSRRTPAGIPGCGLF